MWDRLARLSRELTPPHLWDTYPLDLSVFLSAIGLLIRFLGQESVPQAWLSGFALAGAAALFAGWLADRPQTTRMGAAIMTATWTGQLTFLLITFGTNAPNAWREVANIVLGLAFANLSLGLWVMLRGQRDRRGRWWLSRRTSLSA
jgi:hypothetical protein